MLLLLPIFLYSFNALLSTPKFLEILSLKSMRNTMLNLLLLKEIKSFGWIIYSPISAIHNNHYFYPLMIRYGLWFSRKPFHNSTTDISSLGKSLLVNYFKLLLETMPTPSVFLIISMKKPSFNFFKNCKSKIVSMFFNPKNNALSNVQKGENNAFLF